MSVLICGSLAYDSIMVFQDRFKNHILPDNIHILNVSFLVPQMRREFGGCAGNIAYNLKLLGGEPLIMATVGEDFDPYRKRLEKLGIAQTHIRVLPDTYTAQCFITTDLDHNQITAFHPGAMSNSHDNHVGETQGVKLGIVGPDGRDGMLQHSRDFHAEGIPFVFDPGQGMPLFNGDELKQCLEWATWCTLNDYEAHLMCERTGLSLEAIASQLEGLIVTRGGEGSDLYAGGARIHVPAVRAERLLDPTGCGDAYRGGLLYGLAEGWSLEKSCKLASLMGSIKIAETGPQNHAPSREDVAVQYRAAFGESL